jgi:hypothetical protein
MGFSLTTRLSQGISKWLSHEPESPSDSTVLLNYDRLSYEIRPGDVILVEGRSKVSEVIKLITQSPWTHAAIYIGRLYEIKDESLQERIKKQGTFEPDSPLIIEALLGEGTIVDNLDKYKSSHLRLCRPTGLSPSDAQNVIRFAIERLGTGYNVRQLLDLARFMFPYGYLPRRWRSSLFNHNAGDVTRTVCSTMLAQAFQSVKFPLLPFAEHTENNKVYFFHRNPKLVTPRDFDFSPYFDIIKYPLFGLDDIGIYRHLPWGNTEIVCNDINDCFTAVPEQLKNTITSTDRISSPKPKQTVNMLHAKSIKQGEDQ